MYFNIVIRVRTQSNNNTMNIYYQLFYIHFSLRMYTCVRVRGYVIEIKELY